MAVVTVRAESLTKRTIDLVVGGALSLLLTPLILILAAGAALSLRTWPFFVHWRVGKGGRQFRMVKIRTMPKTTPVYADRQAVAGVVVPPFCAALRRLHLDELPQLYHVALGRMSLVGPRPEMPKFHASMNPDFARLRTSVTPGCTGLWQATDGIQSLHYVVPTYDQVYVANASTRLDLWILWRTLMMLNPLAKTMTLDDIPPRVLAPRGGQVIDLRPAQDRPCVDLTESDLALDA
jgi:lipopolysaccharide/colanic/teichoic acid biosynthesis glycosyltransferase